MKTLNEKDDDAAEKYAREQARILPGSFDTHEAEQAFLAGCRHGRAQEREMVISIVRGLFDTERVGVGTYDVDISENSFAERLRAALAKHRGGGG